MSLSIEQRERVPLATERDGAVGVAGTRVTLDTVVAAFERGATPEEVAQQYPTLPLSDVYSVVGYLLRHREEMAAYQETGRLVSLRVVPVVARAVSRSARPVRRSIRRD